MFSDFIDVVFGFLLFEYFLYNDFLIIIFGELELFCLLSFLNVKKYK